MIDLSIQDKIATLRLNRPPVNALNIELLEALHEHLQSAAEQAKAIILTGHPGMFSAGLDVPTWLTYDHDHIKRAWQALFRVCRQLASSPVPVLAAINGHSPAGGMVLAMFCDERIMAQGDFQIGLNEIQVGLAVPPEIYCPFERLIGKQTAQRLMLTGTLVSPDEALRIGLVDAVCAPKALEAQATARCQTWLGVPQHAMQLTRKHMRADLVAMIGEESQWDLAAKAKLWFDPHTQAALKAMVAALLARKK